MPIKEAQDAPCASLIAFVRAMLVVEDGTRITPLSLHGEGKEESASPPQKGSQPRLAALGSPFQGKEVPRSGGGWMGKRYERQVGKIVSSRPLTRAPYPPLRGPHSPMGKAAKREYCFSRHNAFPLGKAKRRQLGRKKESQPRLAALGSPFQGRGR